MAGHGNLTLYALRGTSWHGHTQTIVWPSWLPWPMHSLCLPSLQNSEMPVRILASCPSGNSCQSRSSISSFMLHLDFRRTVNALVTVAGGFFSVTAGGFEFSNAGAF